MSTLGEFEPKRPDSYDVSWCPGCGNFPLRDALASAFKKLNLKPTDIAIVSGIGQAAKIVHYINTHGFHSLHGRAIPIASALKASNPNLVVIAEGGDGDMYSEGGNHFLHGIRRNSDITVIIHNNQIYGLTKGQGSPTTMMGQHTTTQPFGVFEEPLNAIALAIVLNASFVARAYVGNKDYTADIIAQAINHKGFAVVELFQPCVSFNKVNTYQWYSEHTYIMQNHDPKNKMIALQKALENDPIPLGVFYINNKKTFEENLICYKQDNTPLFKRSTQIDKIKHFIDENF
ncbi:MAG: 2-oxoacid ferredoxin oxidoreductase [Desulfurella sp.]|uniref:thiamine pyrophosphate-dependent enzyme n=1 Tax=Desulfurella sp. TaxID=1962857 RepID=UPI000CC8713B|nr:thiamine pyrophosphate-dependent enzyme [Desulfurella sp.]PMP93470.1 MAG: 2-oxoacid ferredoxin oxidoreductase [Desulfurella sp.]HEX13053.1 2-oxoacid ferredoxin oxidoreductase [Desulfurella acetivorans]